MVNPEHTEKTLLDLLGQLGIEILESEPLDSFNFHIKLRLSDSDLAVSLLQKQGKEYRVEVYSQLVLIEEDKVKMRLASDLELITLIIDIRQFLFTNNMYAEFFLDSDNDFEDASILLSSPLYSKSITIEELDRTLEQVGTAMEVIMGLLQKHLF